jgi:hypothetical protein
MTLTLYELTSNVESNEWFIAPHFLYLILQLSLIDAISACQDTVDDSKFMNRL